MSTFQTVTLHYDDKVYEVEPKRVLGLIDTIEQYVTLEQLCPGPRGYRRASIANAYCAALQYVGCVTATPEKVYASLFDDTTMERLGATVNALIMLMVPPEKLQKQLSELEKAGKSKKK
jgi:hypothetical protein